jgi:hypothetical protein
MGMTSSPTMHFDLSGLFTPIENLDSLVAPFHTDEIDCIVKHMSPDKSPGPDGFNGLFLKKCWPFIKDDFYTLCTEFHQENVNLGMHQYIVHHSSAQER